MSKADSNVGTCVCVVPDCQISILWPYSCLLVIPKSRTESAHLKTEIYAKWLWHWQCHAGMWNEVQIIVKSSNVIFHCNFLTKKFFSTDRFKYQGFSAYMFWSFSLSFRSLQGWRVSLLLHLLKLWEFDCLFMVGCHSNSTSPIDNILDCRKLLRFYKCTRLYTSFLGISQRTHQNNKKQYHRKNMWTSDLIILCMCHVQKHGLYYIRSVILPDVTSTAGNPPRPHILHRLAFGM